MLGKRKRDMAVVKRETGSSSSGSLDQPDNTTQDVFRKHFEANFDPLTASDTATSSLNNNLNIDASADDISDNELNTSDEDEFSGFSDEEISAAPVIEVVDMRVNPAEEGNEIDKIFKKSFMSSKPPRELDRSTAQPESNIKLKNNEEDEEDATNLKNDLDLQRLLRESHLLSQNGINSAGRSNPTSLHGKQRHQATDLRLQELGSKTSLYTQDRMPMSHRKGITTKNNFAEERRRRDARENGVILERAKSQKDARSSSRRERAVDAPILGKFRGGTLSLSKRDVASIQGPAKRGGKRKGKR